MKTKEKKNKKKANSKSIRIEKAEYLNEEVKNFDFADYVRVKSYPRGMLLTFGKAHPGEQKFVFFKEIMIPYDVVLSLQKIIIDQIDGLTEQGILKIEGAIDSEAEGK